MMDGEDTRTTAILIRPSRVKTPMLLAADVLFVWLVVQDSQAHGIGILTICGLILFVPALPLFV
ncbi:MAG TPA: hypothetical protein VGP82_05490, partial [Ktedonobacterales bacterium]|nr:hypothetical protein [Ktedonobacterales bacterium]